MLKVSIELTLDDSWNEYNNISDELLCDDIMEKFKGLGCESAVIRGKTLIL